MIMLVSLFLGVNLYHQYILFFPFRVKFVTVETFLLKLNTGSNVKDECCLCESEGLFYLVCIS